MDGARVDALEWALALAEAPVQRIALRQRPFPDGIDQLLLIAAGNREALQQAAARSGRSADGVLEAVRFYLREMLFHPDADAYRQLGVGRDASQQRIKQHHRLLQQWLHPDRAGSDWDAVYAGRVNVAWNALRTPERRAEYDAAHPDARVVASDVVHWAAPQAITTGAFVEDSKAVRWRRRMPLLLLLAACGVLGIVAVRDAMRQPDDLQLAGDDEDVAALQQSKVEPEPIPGKQSLPVRFAVPARMAARAPSTTAPSGRQALAQMRADAALVKPAAPSAPTTMAATRPASPDPGKARAELARIPPASPVMAGESSPRITPQASAIAAHANAAGVAVADAQPVSIEQVQLAQRTGMALLTFLAGDARTIPPIWNSPAVQQRAQLVRDTLRDGHASHIGEIKWRVDREAAMLRAKLGKDAQLRASLVWREQQWLVSNVAVEPTR